MDRTARASEADLCRRLEAFLAPRLEEAEGARKLRVVELARSTEGFSAETFALEVEVEPGGPRVGTGAGAGARGPERRGYVVKRQPVAGLLEPYDLEPEFRVLHALSDDPLPSPATPWFEAEPAVLERPFYVMEKLPGEAVVPAAGPDGAGPFDESERAALAPQVAGCLAELHAVDWAERGLGFLGPPEPGTGAARRELARWEERIRRAHLPPHPMLAEALHWLRAHVPACDEVVLVHGDYRLGNFLVERAGPATRLTGILDWEMVHLGDPLEDLAWCSSELWRAGTGLASALAPEAELHAAYAAAAGRALDPERLRFYAMLSVVKMLAIMHTGIRAFRDGRTRDLRMAIFDHQIPFLHALLAVERGWLPRGGA